MANKVQQDPRIDTRLPAALGDFPDPLQLADMPSHAALLQAARPAATWRHSPARRRPRA